MDLRIQNKFRLKNKIGNGAFGEVYLAEDLETHEFVAAKLEPKTVKYSQILNEKRAYSRLAGCVGIPRVHWYGKEGDFNVLIIDLLGSSLQQLFLEQKKKFSLKTVLMIAVQVISCIESIHKKGLLHRDIKPENFAIGQNLDENIIFALDFGISSRFIDPKTRKHIDYSDGKSLTGTARYVSLNVHKGIEPTRRDDMEAIAYMLIYFMKGNLPWAGLKCESKEEKYRLIFEKKKQISSDILCEGLPHEFQLFLDDVRRLDFDDEPHYALYRKFFTDLFIREGFVYDYHYDWCHVGHSSFISSIPQISSFSGHSSPSRSGSPKISSFPTSQHSSIYQAKNIPLSKHGRNLKSECRNRHICQSQETFVNTSRKRTYLFEEKTTEMRKEREKERQKEQEKRKLQKNFEPSASSPNFEKEPEITQSRTVRRVKLYPLFTGSVVKPSLRSKPVI